METWDLIVLGGGLAGLTAAASAAQAGRRVLVCERQSHLGGRAATDSTEGFSLNLGPHALYPGGAAFRALRALGIELPGAPPRVVGYAASGGQLHTLPAGPVSLLLSGLLSPAGKWELGRILGSLDRIDPARYQGQSVDQVVASLAANPGARALLRAFLRLSSYCEDTGAHCGAAALDPFLRSARLGVFYVEGGWQTMVDRIASVAQKAGAVLRCGAGIEEIEGGDPWELRTGEGERLRARSVLLTVGPRVASALLGSRAPGLAAFADRAEPLRGACLDVALSSVPRPEVRTLLGIDTPCFASLQSETVRLAPEGGGVIHLIRYLRQGERPAPEHRAELEQLLDGMQPGWRSRVVRQRWMPNLTVSHARVDASAGLAGRPGVSLPGLPGIFLAGDWVGAEGILADASMASASAAAEAILEHTRSPRGKAAA
jgi:phytoene dehydrogenase-like protein